jgi:hypothetical protein
MARHDDVDGARSISLLTARVPARGESNSNSLAQENIAIKAFRADSSGFIALEITTSRLDT